MTPFTPPKSAIFQGKSRKRVNEWRKVTFMKEWVKPLYISSLWALDLPQNLFPSPRTGHLKFARGPTQILYSKFHGLLKPIFHTIYQSNGTQGGVQIIKMEILMNFFHKGGRGSRVPFTYFFGNGFLAKKKHFSAKLKNGCFSVNPAGNCSVVIFGPKYASLGTYRPCRLIWCPVG